MPALLLDDVPEELYRRLEQAGSGRAGAGPRGDGSPAPTSGRPRPAAATSRCPTHPGTDAKHRYPAGARYAGRGRVAPRGSQPMTTPLVCVVDASVAIKLYLAEALAAEAHALFAHWPTRPRFSTPPTCSTSSAPTYCGSRFSAATPRSPRPVAIMRHYRRCRSQRTATFELAAKGLAVGMAQGITAYDACYVALGRRLGIPLITADQKLANKLAGSPYSTRRPRTSSTADLAVTATIFGASEFATRPFPPNEPMPTRGLCHQVRLVAPAPRGRVACGAML